MDIELTCSSGFIEVGVIFLKCGYFEQPIKFELVGMEEKKFLWMF